LSSSKEVSSQSRYLAGFLKNAFQALGRLGAGALRANGKLALQLAR
jgi:hypothetical protein